MTLKGIDISEWQGNITLDNWQKLKDSGIEFVILRCGYTTYGKSKTKYVDKYFENNYKNCKELGIPVGTYYYSVATTIDEAEAEANFVLDLIKDKQFEYPIAIDTEDNHDISNTNNTPTSQKLIGREVLTPIIKRFCEVVEEKDNYVSIYASSSWFNNQLILSDLVLYDKWVAQWSNIRPTSIDHGLWQYTSTGSIAGLNGNIDLDCAYKDYPAIMLENGLNGYTKVEEDDNNNEDQNNNDDQDNGNDSNTSDDNEPTENKNILSKVFKTIFNFIRKMTNSLFNFFKRE